MKMLSFPASLSSHQTLLGFRIGMTFSCTKDRDYSSAYPMRYVPKKARKDEPENDSSAVESLGEKETFSCFDSNTLRMEVSQHISITYDRMRHAKHSTDFLINDDDDNDEVLGDDSMSKSNGTVGDIENSEKDEFELDVPQDSSISREDAEKLAIKLLAGRAYTAVELKKKLIGKRFAVYIVDDVIKNFRIRGLINDCLYAESYSRSRWSSSTWGPKRIQQALLRKGVNAIDTEKAVNSVFHGSQCNDEGDSKLGLSKASMDHLYAQASKQWLRSRGANLETQKSRIVRWLQYRGFKWNVISYILKKLECE
uniref:Regulatory protein RecX n=1 Tax=Kalanchoe fedtschenkoi TaxID=63787 RepID=A0A7N0VMT7_KALFE